MGVALGAGGGGGGGNGDEDDEDDSDFVDEEGEGAGGGAGGGITLANLGLLGGQAGGTGLVLPLHEVVHLLYQTLNGGGAGGGGGGQAILRLEDLQGLLGAAAAGDDGHGDGEEGDEEGNDNATGSEGRRE